MADDVVIKLLKVEQGNETEVASSCMNANNEYGFCFNPDKEGFYLVDNGWSRLPIYAKGNQMFKVDIHGKNDFVQEDIPDEENIILDHWYHSNDTLKEYRWYWGSPITYKEFFPFYKAFLPKMKQQHKLVKSDNTYFNALMHQYIDAYIDGTALLFPLAPRRATPTLDDIPAFYSDILMRETFKSSLILDVPNGLHALKCRQSFKAQYTDFAYEVDEHVALTMDIENDTLKAYYALGKLNKENFPVYSQSYLDYLEPLRATISKIDYLAQKVDEFEVSIKSNEPGIQGYEFTYNDINGHPVSFSDFRGKYVYIDVWATWCGPCKSELPHLIQLENDFHDKNIVFVSISLDNTKNKSKWEVFVKEKGLGGVQLISDNAFDTRVAKDYRIDAIPRFMLFDVDGEIMDANAKRPSNPLLRKQLNNLL